MMICQQCGKRNDPDAVFCVQCSHPLSSPCPSCGTLNSSDARFCKNCAAPIVVDHDQRQKLESLRTSAPQTLQSKLRQAEGEIEGQRKPITILFADIVGSTSIAEKLDPEEWKEVVQGAHHLVSEAVYRYEGMIAQLLGDGVLAFFGAPLTHEDDPERALRAAIDLQQSLEEYRRKLTGFVDDFHMRIGINTGEVVVGPVGTDRRTEYLAIGDAVNVAAHLESSAPPDQILVSKSCSRFVEHIVDFDEFIQVQAKSKVEPVQAAVVLGLKPEPELERGIKGTRSTFVGREEDLAKLQTALDSICQGRGQIVSILGEAGIGKSRLLEHVRNLIQTSSGTEALSSHDPRSIRWLEGRAISYGGSLSFWTIHQLLLSDLGLSDGASQVKVKAALRRRLNELFNHEDITKILPYLSNLLNLTIDGGENSFLQQMDSEVINYQTLIYLVDYFEEVARESPTVLILEDLHWADPSSLQALERLLQITDRAPLMVAILMRIDRDHPSWNLKVHIDRHFPHRLTEIRLHRLDGPQSEQLVEQLFRSETISESISHQILNRAEGNPFYLEELTRHLIDNDLVVEQDGEWVPGGSVESPDLPETLQGVIFARIDHLEDEVRDTLQMASVIGKNFLFKILEFISDREQDLERHLSDLQRLDIIREKSRIPDLEYFFKHSLIQEAAYKSMIKERRESFHLKVGEALEALFPDRLEDFLGLIAHHFQEAGELEKAVGYLVRAGDKARLSDAQDEAQELYLRAIPLLEQLDDQRTSYDLWLRIGINQHMNSKYRQSAQAYLAARTIQEKLPIKGLDSERADQLKVKKDSRTVRILFRQSTIKTLDPGLNLIDYEISRACFAGLTRTSQGVGVRPHLARYWEVSEDGLEYTFHLRDDVYWTDGRSITADQFVWAWMRNISPEIENENVFLFDDIVGAHDYRTGKLLDPGEVGIEARGKLTLVVRLRAPANYFVYITALTMTYPLPYWVIKEHGEEWWKPEHIVSNGFFKLQSYTDEGVTLIRDPDYPIRTEGNLNRVILRTLKSDEEDISIEREYQDYIDNRIDLCRVIPKEIVGTLPEGIKRRVEPNRTIYLLFNPSLHPLTDVRVRRALARAVDPGDIQTVRPLGSAATGGLVHPRTQGHTPGLNLQPDFDAARKDLAEAGYPHGQDFPEIIIQPIAPVILSAANSVSAQLERELGIVCQVRPPSDEINRDDVHIIVGGWLPDYPDPDSVLRFIGRSVSTWLQQQDRNQLEYLFHDAQTYMDRRQRLAMYREIDKWLVSEQVICKPLFYGDYAHYLHRPWIKNLSPDLDHLEDVIISYE